MVLFYHYIARLKRDGYRICHILLLPGNAWPQAQVDDYVAKMRDPSDPSRFTVVPVRAERLYHEGRLTHRLNLAAMREVTAAGRAFHPDIIVAFDMLAAWITREVAAARRFGWLGDLNFQTALLHAHYAARENPLKAIHIPSNVLGCSAWKRVYRAALKGFDQVVAASASSVAPLARLGIEATYEPYPWPETTSERRSGAPATLPAKPTFLFFGSLGGLGSRSALHFTTKKVFPLLRRLWGQSGFRILIAGRGDLSDWARASFADMPEIETLGFVNDLDALLAACYAVLVPIEAPVGNRSRILTAMARRALVIAHANAALGNPDLKDGVTCYLAADAAGFVERMRRAVEERAAADEIIARAHRLYLERFDVEAACAVLSARIGALAASCDV